jgi:hypothetical protein
MSQKNYMLLKAILTDGNYTSEDLMMVECLENPATPGPTPSVSRSPTPTPTLTPNMTPNPTPTVTPSMQVDPEIVLNLANNWTYRYNNLLIIRVIPANSSSNISVLVPVLPSALLPQSGQPAPIPSSASLFVGGNKVGDLSFIGPYFGKSIKLTLNGSQYIGTINIGQIILTNTGV